jgi:hypothetical protein
MVKQTRYWVEGLHIATYLLNILHKKAISTTSPYFILHGVTSSYEYMCMFDCVCYPILSTKATQTGTPVHKMYFPQILR